MLPKMVFTFCILRVEGKHHFFLKEDYMKKSLRQMLSLFFALSLILAMTTTAFAAQPSVVKPTYIGISNLSAHLKVSSVGLASCGATLYNDGDYTVDVTIALQQDGTTIKSWSFTTRTGANSFQKDYYVASGHDYQVIATANVKTSSGILLRSYSAKSTTVSY